MLHSYLRVAKEVLLLCQLCFGIENLQVEVAVGETDDDIAFLYFLTFLCHLLHHDATLFGRDMHHLDRDDRPVQSDIVLELALRNIADGDILCINLQGALVIAEYNPQQNYQHECSSCYVRDVLLLQPSFLFYYSVHSGVPL